MSSSSRPPRTASTASSCAGSEEETMTAPVAEPETIIERETSFERDLLGFLQAAVSEAPVETTTPVVAPEVASETPVRQLVIINWSGEFDRVMPTLIMANAAAAMGYQ